MRWRGCSYFCMGLERQYKACNFALKAEIRWSLKRKERLSGHSSRPVSFLCVFSGHRTTSQKGSSTQKKDMCELSWLYSYYIESSMSKNKKNKNFIFLCQGVFCCLSCGAICVAISKYIYDTFSSERKIKKIKNEERIYFEYIVIRSHTHSTQRVSKKQ